ncbi:hypothetical protein CRUP_020418 [Coryphaenoides rupestris]|nr:hypothetical protein CRUP_020418 [Coryphaenoides rupestris]
MEAGDAPDAGTRATRRSARQASARAPFKKKRRMGKDSVMGAGEDKDDDDDNDDMDVDPDTEVNLEIQTPQEMGLSLDSCHAGQQADHFISFCWSLTTLVGFMLLSAAVVLVCQKGLALQNLTKEVKVGEFSAKLSALQSQFPSQRPELWKRSRIHLERHLQTTRPTMPVSLILAGGRRAERTLFCLARRLASAFAAAHNTSNVLVINGTAVAGRDSDQVKMDIDRKLREAFGGGEQPAAVIHRLEELPPGSTLIFYRYCDHENAAYKRVFLAFTVLLPREDLESQNSLKEVEEIVQDYIAHRFLGSSSQQAFNQMDVDKLSGLWSRISHLILPVAAESQVELGGCQLSLGDRKAASEQSLFTS